MLASFTTRPHFTKSALMRSTVFAGGSISASQPVALILSVTALSCPTFASAWLQRETTSAGNPAGPSTPYQAVESKPFQPTSSIVGTSANAAERVGDVTAIRRMRPLFTAPTAGPSEENSIGIWPPIRSVIAGPPPLYGTCSRLAPVTLLKYSPERWCGPPTPEVP